MSSKSACQKRSLPFASWESHFLSCLTEEGVCFPAEHIFKRTFRKFSDTSVTDQSLLPGHHRDHPDSCLLTAPRAWSLIFFYSITPALPPKPCPSLRPPQPCEHQIPVLLMAFRGTCEDCGPPSTDSHQLHSGPALEGDSGGPCRHPGHRVCVVEALVSFPKSHFNVPPRQGDKAFKEML